MTNDTSDEGLVDRLGLTKAQVADAIGKSRQALHASLAKAKNGRYFSDKDLTDLYRFAIRYSGSKDAALVKQHVETTRADNAANILTDNGDLLGREHLAAAEIVCAVIPAYDFFADHLVPHHKLLVERARKSPETFVPMTSTEQEAALFWRSVFGTDTDIDHSTLPRIVSARVDGQAYAVFLNPHNADLRSAYVLCTYGYHQQPRMRGTKMFASVVEGTDIAEWANLPEPLRARVG